MTYFQAIVLGVLQGVTELFPVSSLGHSVILPKLLGWDEVVAAQQADESFFLAFLVGLHVATALALLVFYRARWIAIVASPLVRSSTRGSTRETHGSAGSSPWPRSPQPLAGLLLEHGLRVLFATPLAAALLLVVNGVDVVGRRAGAAAASSAPSATRIRGRDGRRPLDRLEFREAAAVGIAQAAALLPGISRSGITMVAGLARGLEPQRRRGVLVPAGDTRDPGRRAVQTARPPRAERGRRSRTGRRGQPRRRHLRVPVGAVPDALLPARELVPFGIYSIVVGTLAVVRFA